ncbi:hypothetical protein SBF1_6570004 [Candidatus Desulfosporosinus infrequens]|uniref:Uncharacterized protein n=1 Tax=Candidatus Desulfosporosinus infrequens TaxID=2043169 RepID=A0A2U3LNE5_9FIRM|nr:hypothetical protein SBF1_6570004 [Candidatus Desulfosporosinus infrequens]
MGNMDKLTTISLSEPNNLDEWLYTAPHFSITIIMAFELHNQSTIIEPNV